MSASKKGIRVAIRWTRAARSLDDAAMAQHDYGMRNCYAKVYDYNEPSRRALEKPGFEELGIYAAPDDDQLSYRCGEQLPMESVVDELHLLLARMESDTRAAALVRCHA